MAHLEVGGRDESVCWAGRSVGGREILAAQTTIWLVHREERGREGMKEERLSSVVRAMIRFECHRSRQNTCKGQRLWKAEWRERLLVVGMPTRNCETLNTYN